MRSPLDDVTPAQRTAILAVCLGPDGRIALMPRKWVKKLVLLDHVAQRFDIGVYYSELEVNAVLRELADDYVAVRRYLVDAGFLSRDAGTYWRTGGSVSDE